MKKCAGDSAPLVVQIDISDRLVTYLNGEGRCLLAIRCSFMIIGPEFKKNIVGIGVAVRVEIEKIASCRNNELVAAIIIGPRAPNMPILITCIILN